MGAQNIVTALGDQPCRISSASAFVMSHSMKPIDVMPEVSERFAETTLSAPEQVETRDLLARKGVARGAEFLRVSRCTALQAASGLPVRRGTAALVRARLAVARQELDHLTTRDDDTGNADGHGRATGQDIRKDYGSPELVAAISGATRM
jgi:hypothetical protein